MEKIKFITDTACDIPLSTALAQGVEEAPLTVTVLGRTYRESYDISPQEFYDLCGQSKELPVSAGVNSTEYYTRLERAWEEEILRAYLREAGFANLRLTGDLSEEPPGLNEDRWQFQAN